MVADASGHGERRLTRRGCYEPVFSPDGSRLACEINEPWIITVLDAGDGSVVAETADCCYRPAWSPDGRRMAYNSIGTYDQKSGKYLGPSGLFVMKTDGTDKRLITKKPVSFEDSPAWSSRGTIAFMGEGAGSGRSARRELGFAESSPRTRVPSADLPGRPTGRSWPSKEVTATSRCSSSTPMARDSRISRTIRRSKTSGRRGLLTGRRSRSSVIETSGLDQIFAMRVDGSGQTQLTHDDAWNACCPTWSPRT